MNHVARLFLALLAIAGSPAGPENPYVADLGVSESRPILAVQAVSQPAVHDASLEQRERLHWAVGRFTDMGFALPPLDVTFHNDRADCHGFNGTYQLEGEIAVIDICVTKRHTILHELGHAWEAQAVTDETRVEFMAYRGLTSWSDQDVEWDERGIEQAAVTIAMVLKWQSGSTGNPEFVERLCSYEVLTGKPLPDSVLVDCGVGQPVEPTLR
jgi:hypothetical protein